VVGRYAKVIICSGYNETTKKYDIEAANEVIKGAEKSAALKIPVEDILTAGTLSIKHSKSGMHDPACRPWGHYQLRGC